MATRPPRERESPVQKSIIAQLGHLGISLERRNVGAARYRNPRTGKTRLVRFAKAGQSDLWGMDWPRNLPWGRHWEIETKRWGEKPTDPQLEWLWKAMSRGCVAFWVDNAATAERVARAVLDGGRIIWISKYIYDVEMF
jgi:hypothetical protein